MSMYLEAKDISKELEFLDSSKLFIVLVVRNIEVFKGTMRKIKSYSLRFLKIFPLTVPTDTKKNQVVWGIV